MTTGWKPRPLRYFLFSNEGGIWGDEPNGTADDTVVLRSTDISLGGGWSIEEPAIRAVDPGERQRKRLLTGDLIVVKSSGSAQHLGKTALVTPEVSALEPCFANFVQRLRPASAADPRYIWYLLNSDFAVSQIAVLGTTTTGLRNINGEILGGITCPGPPLEIQIRIADYLDVETRRIDAVISKKMTILATMAERRLTVTIDAVSGRLIEHAPRALSSLEWLEDRPAHWDEALLRLVARLGSGHTPSRERPEWWEDCTIPWITTGEVAQLRSDRIEYLFETRERISEAGLANSSAVIHPAGTVVLCRTASAGYSGIMGIQMATSQDFATWTCGHLLRPRFLLLCLRGMRADLLGRLAMGSTHQTIYMPDIQGIRIPIPPIGEQDLIVEETWKRLRVIDAITERLVRQVELVHEHRRALITAAVTGDFEIPGAWAA